MTAKKIKNSWRIDFRHEHIRYRKRSPENSKAGAQAYELVLRQRLARGESLVPIQKFKDFSKEWFGTYVKNNNKHSEIKGKEYILQGHLVPFFGETPIDKIDTQQIERYKAKKISEGLANKTINNHLTVLSTCLRTAQEWLNLTKIPKIKKLKLPPLKHDFLSVSEGELLLAHSHGTWHEIIFAALKTGLRIGELKALSWPDINFHNKTLTVRHSWCGKKNAMDTPKSNRERQIPLNDELFAMLTAKKKVSDAVFVDERNKRFSAIRLNKEISKACKNAGINKKITCHILRHTFASQLAMKDASIQAIQKLLGHAQIQTTMRYAHLADSKLKDTVALLDSPEKASVFFGQPVDNQSEELLKMESVEKQKQPIKSRF